jgi:hypothetical protein
VASSREPEKYVGQAATGELPGWIAQTPEAVYQATGLDGRRVYGVFTRSQLSGWTVAAGVPVETVEATLLWKRVRPVLGDPSLHPADRASVTSPAGANPAGHARRVPNGVNRGVSRSTDYQRWLPPDR